MITALRYDGTDRMVEQMIMQFCLDNPPHRYRLEGSDCAVGGSAHDDCLRVFFMDGDTKTQLQKGDWLVFEPGLVRLHRSARA